MQTFLPYPSFVQSAKCLDNKRLGKQRVECMQIHKALTIQDYGWKNHPAVKMWKGYEPTLLLYAAEICNEWINRGFKDSLITYFWIQYHEGPHLMITPPWLTKEFCDSHKSNLLRKNPEWYSQFNWDVPNNLPYIWPVK